MIAAAAEAVQTTPLLQVAQVIDLAVCLAAVFVLARRWRSEHTTATGWALAIFALLALVVAAGQLHIEDDGSAAKHVFTVGLVCVLLLVPYLLVRFARSLGAVSDRGHRIAVGLTLAQLVMTVASPRFPQPGEDSTLFFTFFLVVVLAGWTTQSVIAACGLWAAGRGQPSVVRHRMRALSLGAVVIAVALVAGTGSSDPKSTAQAVTTMLGVVGICLLVLAFLVPEWLRAAWRASDLVELGTAERGLMTAVTPYDVGVAIVPAMVQLFGGHGAALLDGRGQVVVSQGVSDDDIARLHEQLLARDPAELVSACAGGAFGCRLSEGWLVLQAGSFAPVFGPAERSLLDRVGSFVDLALERSRLFGQEAQSRAAAEAANAELQTLVYSVSHDLRNPIISVLGYLDVLAQEHAGQLQGEGARYLERISVNALYMQSLIQDLLELSRIGRAEPPAQQVPVGALTTSVAQEVGALHPACAFGVSGHFPLLWMSELRARQLLTNLLDNAAKHAGGEARVVVEAVRESTGHAVILISDNGRGIAPQYREKAFDVFERLDAARSDIPGTGMGLPICKRIMESLGGTIALEGPRAGSDTGTTVRLDFPPTAVQGWGPAPPSAPIALPSPATASDSHQKENAR